MRLFHFLPQLRSPDSRSKRTRPSRQPRARSPATLPGGIGKSDNALRRIANHRAEPERQWTRFTARGDHGRQRQPRSRCHPVRTG